MRLFLVVLFALTVVGCSTPDYERAKIQPPAKVRTAPTEAQLRRCLGEIFTRHLPAELIRELRAALRTRGEAWFQVPVTGSFDPYYRRHFVAYLSSSQVLVVGRIYQDESVGQLGAWYVASPETVPVPTKPPPPVVKPPGKCPKCGFKKLLPSYKNCPGCNAPLTNRR